MQTDDIVSATEHILALRNYPRKPTYIAAALEDIFAHFGHIPEAAKPIISDYFDSADWPAFLDSNIFYRTTDAKSIQLCEGPCCKNAGSDQLAKSVQAELQASVERRHCMGSCQKAPAAMIDGKLIPEATIAKIRELLH